MAAGINHGKRLKKICTTHKAVTGLKLSRNFGQHNAIAAGLRVSKRRLGSCDGL